METRVLIVDDFPLARAGIASALRPDPSIRVVGKAGTAAEAIARVRELEPDVVLLDLRLPDGGGPDLIRALLAEADSVRVLVLTAIEKVGTIREVRDAGASGYVTKRIAARDLRGAILTVRGFLRGTQVGVGTRTFIIQERRISVALEGMAVDMAPPRDLLPPRDLARLDLAKIVCDPVSQDPCPTTDKCLLATLTTGTCSPAGSTVVGGHCNADPDPCVRGARRLQPRSPCRSCRSR